MHSGQGNWSHPMKSGQKRKMLQPGKPTVP